MNIRQFTGVQCNITKGCIMDKIKGNENLHSEIEVEEIYDDSEEQARVIQDNYNKRKHAYALRIMSELEALSKDPLTNGERTKRSTN